jgi:trimeric autotransporter adhesin
MPRLRMVAPLLIVLCLLLTACQPSPTPLAPAPTAVSTLAQSTPTTPLTATPAPTQVQAATTAASPTAAPTVVPSAATPAPTQVQAATADAGVSATQFKLTDAWGVAFDAGGNLYVSTCGYTSMAQIDPSGLAKAYTGLSLSFGGDGGPARLANFYCMGGIAFGPDGSLYVADQGNNPVRRIAQDGTVSTVAGSGAGGDVANISYGCCFGGFAGDGGPATAAQLWNPTDVAFDQQGNLYIADHNNNRVRQVDTTGIITTVAGNGTAGFSGDGGPATAARLNTESPYVITPDLALRPFNGMSIALDAAGNLYIGDSGNARVRQVDTKGIITTIAGTGVAGFAGDGGRAKVAQLSRPSGLAFDAAGNLYIADGPTSDLIPKTFISHRIRKIDTAGVITTVAGTGAAGFSGDGGPATAATLNVPSSIVFDTQGNLYFADGANGRIRKIDKAGIITTVAGSGVKSQ